VCGGARWKQVECGPARSRWDRTLAFDATRREVAERQRPWHRALIAEHAARFYLAHGLEHAGHDLLAQARQEYLTWGATAKVAQLDWAYPARQPPTDPAATAGEQSGDLTDRRAAVTAGTVDLLGILSASQAPPASACCCGTPTGRTGCYPHPAAAPYRSAAPARKARRRCRCCATCSGRANRWPSATPPGMTGSPGTRTSPALTAARCWPCRSSAAVRCERCCCWKTASSAARSPPVGWTRSSSSRASSPSPSTTPSYTPSPARSANAVKHAQASAVQVELGADDTMVRLAIRDDGIGGADPAQGSGLTGLWDRIEAVGGTLKVTSPAGSGTALLIEMPVSPVRSQAAYLSFSCISVTYALR